MSPFARVSAIISVVGCFACAPPDDGSSSANAVLTVASVSLDTKVAAMVPDVSGRYWLTMTAQLDNRSDADLPLAFVLFRATSDAGVSVDAAPYTELASDGCRMGEYVSPGALTTCRLAFALEHGQLPASLSYRDLDGELVASADVGELCGGDEPDLCGLDCVDLSTDLDHCGECGRAAVMSCIDGEPSCGELTLCDGECVDTAFDHGNCGACGRTVPENASCTDGEVRCFEGFADCGDGVCIDIVANPDHCGACDTPVPSGGHCEDGERLCDGADEQVCNDTCIDVSTSHTNCGGCGRTCPAFEEVGVTVFCTSGPTCKISFPTPGGTCDDACEAFDWSCAYAPGGNACPCGGSYPAGDCACRCDAPVTEP